MEELQIQSLLQQERFQEAVDLCEHHANISSSHSARSISCLYLVRGANVYLEWFRSIAPSPAGGSVMDRQDLQLLIRIVSVFERLRYKHKTIDKAVWKEFAIVIVAVLDELANGIPDDIASSLLQEIIFFASLPTIKGDSGVQIALLSYFASRNDYRRVIAVAEMSYPCLCHCKAWLTAVCSQFDKMVDPVLFLPLRRLELKLNAQFWLSFILLKAGDTQSTLKSNDIGGVGERLDIYASHVEECDAVLPHLKSDALDWTHLRLEHFARIKFLRGLLLSMQKPNVEDQQPALELLAASLMDLNNSVSSFQLPQRVLEAFYLIYSVQHLQKPARKDNKDGKSIHQIIPRRIVVSDAENSLTKDVLFRLERRHIETSSWDLDLFVSIFSWHLSDFFCPASSPTRSGTHNLLSPIAILQSLFPKMPRKQTLSSPMKMSSVLIQSKPSLLDMEVFIICLVISRCSFSQGSAIAGIRSSILGMSKFPAIAYIFWHFMLIHHGVDLGESNYYSSLTYDPLEMNQILHEVRGASLTQHRIARTYYGLLSLFFGFGGVGSSYSSRQRYHECKFYRDVYLNWDQRRMTTMQVPANLLLSCSGGLDSESMLKRLGIEGEVELHKKVVALEETLIETQIPNIKKSGVFSVSKVEQVTVPKSPEKLLDENIDDDESNTESNEFENMSPSPILSDDVFAEILNHNVSRIDRLSRQLELLDKLKE